jgi:hypothetical protein
MWDYTLGMRIDEGLGQVLVSPKTVLGSEDMNNTEGPRQVERMVLE